MGCRCKPKSRRSGKEEFNTMQVTVEYAAQIKRVAGVAQDVI